MAQSQVQVGFVRLGKGLSLPEALAAVFDLGQ